MTSATPTLLICTLLLLTGVLAVVVGFDTSLLPLVVSTIVWSGMLVCIYRGLRHHHPHLLFGSANAVTSVRAAGTAFLAGLIPLAHHSAVFQAQNNSPLLWALTILVLTLLALDGVDGYLARRSQLESSFGARFDMEIDAFLALVLSLLIWRAGITGFWVLALGSLRYLFIAASIWSQPLRGELFPSMRRKLVCVIQIAALCIMLSPLLSATLTSAVGLVALLCLTVSFGIDLRWLYQQPLNYPHDPLAAPPLE